MHNIPSNVFHNMPDVNMNSSQMLFNMMLMTIMGAVITSLSNAIPIFVNKILNYFWSIVDNISRRFGSQENEVIVSSTCIKSQDGTIEVSSYDYDAILFKINSKKINTKRVKSKANTTSRNNFSRLDDYKKKSENDISIADYNIIHSEYIILSKKNDIRVKCNTVNDSYSNYSGYNQSNIIDHNIHIYSKKLIVSEIIKKINKWKIEFMNHKKKYVSDGKIYHYNFSKDIVPAPKINKSREKDIADYDWFTPSGNHIKPMNIISSSITWDKNILISTKTFDNIFFTDKNNLVKRLNYFLNNRHEYARKGIPYNMGLLFYGPPGCGKTSCIKAISNYTGRHVVEINLKHIKTCKEFINVFHNEFINDDYVPIDKRIIVLEDIDCMIDIVKQRKDDFDEEEYFDIKKMKKKPEISTDDLYKMTMINKFNNRENIKDGDLTLSCILNTIDGILEQNGRILIITTNYKDKLDSALLRPGRVDMKINFTKCTDVMMRNMIEHFYNKKIPNVVEFIKDHYTPAEIVEKCFYNSDKMDSVLASVSLVHVDELVNEQTVF